MCLSLERKIKEKMCTQLQNFFIKNVKLNKECEKHCEHCFRQLRSITTAIWTKINFSLLELLHMMGCIELQNEIAHFKLQNLVNIPRVHNQNRKHEICELSTDEDLLTLLQQALNDAMKTAAELNMIVDIEEVRLCELNKRSGYSKQNVKKNSGTKEKN